MAIQHRIKRSAQPLVIIVAQSYETERLEASIHPLACAQHLGHSVHCPGPGVEGDLDKLTMFESSGEVQHAACGGDSLKFGASPVAVVQKDCR